jgi:hypothetical protein
MPRVNSPLWIVACILAFTPLAGCELHRPTAVPVKPAATYPVHTEARGLAAAVEPYDTEAKTQQTLGSSSLARAFTPVLLVVENQDPEKLHLQRGNAKLVCTDGRTLDTVSALAMYERLLDIGGSNLARSHTYAYEQNDRIRTDWMVKEFPAETILTMGRRVAGFLYFRGMCSERNGRLVQITADMLTSPDTIQLALDLDARTPRSSESSR